MLMSQVLNSIIELIKSKPEYAWGLLLVFLAGVLPWMGIRWQLKHDSKERREELRRDIFLKMAEQIGKKLNYLANYYDSKESFVGEFVELLEKIEVIGSFETIEALFSFNDYMNESIFELIPLRAKIMCLEKRNTMLLNLSDHVNKRMSKCLEKMKEYNIQKLLDEEKRKLILSEYEQENIAFNEIHTEIEELGKELLKQHFELGSKCLEKYRACEEISTQVILAIRKELCIKADEFAYRDLIKKSNEKWNKNFETYMAKMESLLSGVAKECFERD